MVNIHAARIWDVFFLEFPCTLLYLGFRAFSGMFLVNWGLPPSWNWSTGTFRILHNQLQCKTALRDKLSIILYIWTSLELWNSPLNLQFGKCHWFDGSLISRKQELVAYYPLQTVWQQKTACIPLNFLPGELRWVKMCFQQVFPLKSHYGH